MARHTSWRAGGAARYYAEPTSPEQAQALVAWARASELPLLWVGRGTNSLVRDEGFAGVLASYRAQAWQLEEHGDEALLRVEAGAPMAGLARRIAAMGYAGLTWAEGLPGTVGGAVFGNAGCYGGDTAGILHSAELLLQGEQVEIWPAERLGFGYRTSVLKRGEAQNEAGSPTQQVSSIKHHASRITPPLVLAATFRLIRGEPATLTEQMARIAAERKGKTPSGSSCGSVFKNPPGESAGRLIERAGLKGQTRGGATISPLHANYIVNTGGATAGDILGLAESARAEVFRQLGITLELEVRVI